MTHRTMMAVGLLVALSLGGCLGGSTDEGPAAPSEEQVDGAAAGAVAPSAGAPPPTNTSVVLGNLTGCQEQLGLFPLPEEPFLGELPEGFAFVPFEGVPGTISSVVFASSCQTGALDGEPVEGVSMLVGALLVDPPSELAGATESNAILLGGFTTSEPFAGRFREHGLDIEHGPVDFAVTATPALRAGTVHAEADGFTVAFASVVPGAVAGESGFSVRVFGTSGNRAVAFLDLRAGGGDEYGPGEGNLVISEVPPTYPPALVLHSDGPDHGYEMVFERLVVEDDPVEDASAPPVQTNGGFEKMYQNARNEKKSVK